MSKSSLVLLFQTPISTLIGSFLIISVAGSSLAILMVAITDGPLQDSSPFYPVLTASHEQSQALGQAISNADNRPVCNQRYCLYYQILETNNTIGASQKDKKIIISLEDQNLIYAEGANLIGQMKISSGMAGASTPKGEFKVLVKKPALNLMFKKSPSGSFYIRGADWHNKFGEPVSRGSLGVAYADMEPLYHWAEEGTKVIIQDESVIAFADGALVRDTFDNRTIYMINAGVKQGFTSPEVFSGLGYKFSQVVRGNLSKYSTGQPIGSLDEPHPEGALVKNGTTIYKITRGGKELVPNLNVFYSWNWQTRRVVQANAADLALPDLDTVKYRNGTLFKTDAGTIHIALHGRLRPFAVIESELLEHQPVANLGRSVAGLTILQRDGALPQRRAQDSKKAIVLGTGTSLADGSLVQAMADPRVYYLANGMKHWILSPEAFHSQGFRWQDIVAVSAEELDRYQESEPFTEQSQIVLPDEAEVLPDLTPFAVKDLRLDQSNGRSILRFSSLFWNQGKGKFELVTDPEMRNAMRNGYLETFQHIVRRNGSYRDKSVGNFLWHEAHKHYHYGDFADYRFELVKASDTLSPGTPSAITQKTTFCMRDNEPVALDLKGAPQKKVFTRCQNDRQGVSVGWADKYAYTLPEQFIDVSDMPPGIYRFSFLLDPRQRFVEGDQDNNVSVTFLELDVLGGVVKAIASGAPFASSENRYPNGMLVQGFDDSRIYTIHNNKKLLLGSRQALDSLGFLADTIYELPQSVLEVIPPIQLVRVAGRDEIYVLNKAGFKRHILTPQVFSSYGWDPQDTASINLAQLRDYPETDLIRRAHDGSIYSVTSKRHIGNLDSLPTLGLNPESVHTVNEVDFSVYGF